MMDHHHQSLKALTKRKDSFGNVRKLIKKHSSSDLLVSKVLEMGLNDDAGDAVANGEDDASFGGMETDFQRAMLKQIVTRIAQELCDEMTDMLGKTEIMDDADKREMDDEGVVLDLASSSTDESSLSEYAETTPATPEPQPERPPPPSPPPSPSPAHEPQPSSPPYSLPKLDSHSRAFVRSLAPAPRVEYSHLPSMTAADRLRSDGHTLVLDLDETLVHSAFDPYSATEAGFFVPPETERDPTFGFRVNVTIPNAGLRTVSVKVRPYARHFLREVTKHFEVIAFTAGYKSYANAVLNVLDPGKEIFRHRLFRDDCYIKDGRFVKNLAALGRDLDRTVIVDNSYEAFGFQVDNGLPIQTWVDDPEDKCLLDVLAVLKDLRSKSALQTAPQYLADRFALSRAISEEP